MALTINAALRTAAFEADDQWSKALRTAYGRRAGDARYDARGYATPELLALKDAKLAADAAYWERAK